MFEFLEPVQHHVDLLWCVRWLARFEHQERLTADSTRKTGENTLRATALVHELFLRLANVTKVEWYQGGQFVAMVAQMMRILVDAARARGARKRGGAPKVNLDVPTFPQAKTEYDSLQ